MEGNGVCTSHHLKVIPKRQRVRSNARNETINRKMEKIRDKVFVAWIEINEKKNYLETTNHF